MTGFNFMSYFVDYVSVIQKLIKLEFKGTWIKSNEFNVISPSEYFSNTTNFIYHFISLLNDIFLVKNWTL